MRKTAFSIPTVAMLGVAVATCSAPSTPGTFASAASSLPQAALSHAEVNDVVDEYCVRCHSDRRQTGNLSLEGFDAGDSYENAEVTEKMIRKLRAGMMPPRGANRPDASILAGTAADLETTIDDAAARNPNPGTRTFQRLNRAEYARAVRDLLGIEVDVAQYLPPDTKSANFDNIADAQVPSATLVEGYLRAAAQISQVALGDPEAEISSTIYRVPKITSQKERVEGAPLGTRGGVSVIHNFPADGKYVFHVMPYNAVEGEVFGRTFGTEQMEIAIDGERVALMTVDRWMRESEPTGLNMRTDSLYVQAGPRRLTVAFLRQFEGDVDDLIRPIDHTMADGQIGIGYGVTTQQHLQRVTVLGPFDVTGVSETPTRRAIFTCRPTSPAEARPCAESIVTRLTTQAYRRPASESDVESLMGFYDSGEGDAGFEGGVRMALRALLASPHFVFRMEEAPRDAQLGDVYRISDVDLASRLSFFLWGAPPDAELIDLAARERLSDSRELARQVDRMLADPRAEALAPRFASQWLRLQDLEKIHPDALNFPYYDQTLADAMLRETELLFNHLVEEDRSVLELLTADYTFVNERLARHYGIPGVLGTDFRRVPYPDDRRRGILGHGSILTMTSHANRTSPVIRGKWVMEVLMGSPPPPPPPNVPTLEETGDAADGRFLTVRERQEIHRANPACNSCHSVIDPIGLVLENFGVTGAWRARDGGNLVDPAGELFDGTPLDGAASLREAIVDRSEVFYQIFTENLMAYALGRRVEYFDMPTVRAITSLAAGNNYSISSFIHGVVASDAFQSIQVAPAMATTEAGNR